MGIRETAHEDMLEILHDTEDGGEEITITSPAEVAYSIMARTSDIHLSIDPGTGETVTGRQCFVAVAISDLIARGFEDIRGVAESDSKPWLVDAVDVDGRPGRFKVTEVNPDRTIGLAVLALELYS